MCSILYNVPQTKRFKIIASYAFNKLKIHCHNDFVDFFKEGEDSQL